MTKKAISKEERAYRNAYAKEKLSSIAVNLQKEKAELYKEICRRNGEKYSEPLQRAITEYIEKNNK